MFAIAGGACGGMDLYVDVEDIRRRKAEQKRQKEAAGRLMLKADPNK